MRLRRLRIVSLFALLAAQGSIGHAQLALPKLPLALLPGQEVMLGALRGIAGSNPVAAAIAVNPLLDRARAAERADDLEGAARHYREALDLLGPSAPASPPVVGALTGYGAVLVELRRWEEARSVLSRAAESRIALQRQGVGLLAFGSMMGGVMHAASEGARMLNLNIVIEGESGDPRGDFARERLPAVRDPAVLLARAELELGNAAAVQSLYRDYVSTLEDQRTRAPAPFAEDASVIALSNAPAEAVLLTFAALLDRSGSRTLAQEALERASRLNLERLRDATRFPLPEVFLAAARQRRLMTGLFLQQALEQPSDLTIEALRWIASSKGVATGFAMTRRAVINAETGLLAGRGQARLDELEARLAQMPLVGEAGLEAYARWQNEYAGAIEAFRPALTRARIDQSIDDGVTFVERVRRSIGTDAYIGFIQYRPLDRHTLGLGEPRYLRYVVTADALRIRDVGSRREIDRAVGQWRMRIDRPLTDLPEDRLAKALLADLPASAQRAAAWHLAPDGMLHLLPFEALREDDGQAVVQRRGVRYVDVLPLVLAAGEPRPAGPAIVVGDPAFASGGANAPSQLPETRSEARSVAGALQRAGLAVRVVTGSEAKPSVLRSARAPAVLHVATHGFVHGAQSWPMEDGRSTRVGVIVPGHMSGLLLAPEGERTTFTASDLAALDLRGTELVVLSACDTGNGAVDVGEGLTSLRRAALIAGAHNVVTSLWAVPSAQTAELMARFHEYVARGERAPQALQRVKAKAAEAGWPVRAWAGFVLAAPLEAPSATRRAL